MFGQPLVVQKAGGLLYTVGGWNGRIMVALVGVLVSASGMRTATECMAYKYFSCFGEAIDVSIPYTTGQWLRHISIFTTFNFC